MLIEKTDKWKAVSHLQKCIRRGWSEHIPDVARALWSVDNAYLRYRLAVIAAEDVGIGNIDAVSSLMEDKINKRWVDANGGIEGLIVRMQGLADGVKDRTACTWGSLASRQAFEALHGDWEAISATAAAPIAFDSAQSLSVRAAAALRAAGTNLFSHGAFPDVEGDWESWMAINAERGASEQVLHAMRQGQKSQKEWHPAFLGMCWVDYQVSPSEIVTTTPKNFGDVHGYVSAAIDSHTAEGQKAIAQWWRRTIPLRQQWSALGWSGTDADAVGLLSSMVFLLEGGAVDKRLGYATAQAVEQTAKDQWALGAGIPGKEAATAVWKTMPQLQECRLQYVRPQRQKNMDDIDPNNAGLFGDNGP